MNPEICKHCGGDIYYHLNGVLRTMSGWYHVSTNNRDCSVKITQADPMEDVNAMVMDPLRLEICEHCGLEIQHVNTVVPAYHHWIHVGTQALQCDPPQYYPFAKPRTRVR